MATRDDVLVGSYNGFWGGLAIGQVGLGGYKIRQTYNRRDINFDSVGMTPVDTLFMGVNLFVDFVVMQYNQAAIKSMTWPWTVRNLSTGNQNIVRGESPAGGASMFDYAKPLVLVACNTELNPSCITFYKTIIAPDFEQVINLSGVEERMIPMRMMVFPIAARESPNAAITRPTGCNGIVHFTETYPTITGAVTYGPQICNNDGTGGDIATEGDIPDGAIWGPTPSASE
jgi:hypothetical protein